ncbi:hypothetical protein [Rickettsiella massiliensis]|uniref:hypothetical protein n=1 Tax=Rickettsiella massiliensis TaxID=676517 RepID=UPI00029B1273|nr:hypothetical protein [Rickettsiella massiliensis]
MIFIKQIKKVFNFIDKNLISIILTDNQKIIANSLDFTIDGLFGFGTELIRQAILNKKKWIKNKLFYDMDAKKPYSYRGFHLIRNIPE